jgi:hypothetical protein
LLVFFEGIFGWTPAKYGTLGFPMSETLASSAAITSPLMLGNRGKDVQTLQSLLNRATIPGPGLIEDGIFGIKTDHAVRAFQQQKGLQLDGIAGALTAQALGAKFIHQLIHQSTHQPQPAPKPDPPGTTPPFATTPPEAVLMRVIGKELKEIHNTVSSSFDNGYGDMPEVYDRARKYLKSALKQALFVLAPAAHGGMPAGFTAGQTSMAIFLMVGGLGTVAGQVSNGGATVRTL